MPINGSDLRVEGKLVDLDPEQQTVSEIWGFQVVLGYPSSLRGIVFRSDFNVAGFADMWTRYPQGGPPSSLAAFYQSVLSNVQWRDLVESRFLDELLQGEVNQLSIRFNVDGFDDTRDSDTFTFGRVVGTIGHYHDNEPQHFVAKRRLTRVVNAPATVNTAYADLEADHVIIDLGNSLPTTSVGGPQQNLGHLHLALLPSSGVPIILGEIDYQDQNWYAQTAGIQRVHLTFDQATQAASTPLAVVQTTGSGPQTLLAESAEGMFVRADTFVFRLQEGGNTSSSSAQLFATKFGQPLPSETINLTFDNSSVQSQQKQGPISGPPAGTPESALTFDTSVTTDSDGRAEVTLTAGAPCNPRGYIDGQVYGVSYALESNTANPASPSDMLNVLVWDTYTVPDEPTWLNDVAPIFQQYANLYPIMKPIVDLANYAGVYERLNILKPVFNVPRTDPNYMPVTRDLSDTKAAMIRKFLNRPVYMRCDTVAEVQTALQQAVELEHATLPLYLCALYSIKPGRNVEIANLIRSIVLEEMLHMGLACNLLISIGGSPHINKPGFVPLFPGPLPGGLRGGLTVHLRRCSIEQIRDVFMSVEEPEETIEVVDGSVEVWDPVERHAFTIGWFYDRIEHALAHLSHAGTLAFGNVAQQVQTRIGTKQLYPIDSLETARGAIREIKHQGEGAGLLNPDVMRHSDELAHYYKFSEIVQGKRIVMNAAGFSYDGAVIPFDPDGVYPMMDDPDIARLQPGSHAYILSTQFNQTYQALLNALHQAFNGEPASLGAAVGLMYSLNLAARQLMEIPSGLGDGTTAGPSFQVPIAIDEALYQATVLA